jgi:hypothetical protein
MAACCEVPKTAGKVPASACPVCHAKGKPVGLLTVRSLVKRGHQSQIGAISYLFCETSTCPVVYFDGEGNHFDKSHLRVRVGLKETEDPIPVCYCFDFTERKILDEIAATGQSTVMDYITKKVQAGECACEIKNPSGCCCLGNVNKVVKREIARISVKAVSLTKTGVEVGGRCDMKN